jgi:hypothetical protein
MAEADPHAYDTRDIEKSVGVWSDFGQCAERFLPRIAASSRRFEMPLPLTEREVAETLGHMSLRDLFLRAGDVIGEVTFEPWLDSQEDQVRDAPSILGKFGLSYANALRIPERSYSTSLLVLSDAHPPEGPPERFIAVSMLYGEEDSRYTGQQVVGLYARATGVIEALRIAHFDFEGERVYRQKAWRPSKPSQTKAFISHVDTIFEILSRTV